MLRSNMDSAPTSASSSRREFLARAASGIVGAGAAFALAGCAPEDSNDLAGGGATTTDPGRGSSVSDLTTDATTGSVAAPSAPATLPPPTGGGQFVSPTVIESVNGVLEATLTAAAAMVPFGDRQRFALSYNGDVNGPTLVAHPGDVLKVRLVNGLDEPTNLHTHGLHVSPDGSGDNPFRVVEPGASFDYEFAIPADHPTGTFWYHPHHHGMVAAQVHGGLAGALVISDPNAASSGAGHQTERVLVITDPTATADADGLAVTESQRQNGREGNVILVNGQIGPADTVGPGSVEHWRIVNACVSRYHDLSVTVDGEPVEFEMIGTDQGYLPAPILQRWHRLTPGQRVEVRLPVPQGATTVELFSTPVGRGSAHTAEMGGMHSPSAVDLGPTSLLRLSVDAATAATPAHSTMTSSTGSNPTDASTTDGTSVPAAVPATTGVATTGPATTGVATTGVSTGAVGAAGTTVAAGSTATSSPDASPSEVESLANLVTVRREIQLGAMAMGPDEFVIDGKNFDPDRIDIEVAAGSVEEWTIGNGSMMNHPFHLHVWPFQVISRSGAEPDPGWRDVVDIAPGEAVTIRVDFRSMTGKTVYHCHILDHEDFGMMGIVSVS